MTVCEVLLTLSKPSEYFEKYKANLAPMTCEEIISFFDKYGEPQQCVFHSEFLHQPDPLKVREYKRKILDKAYEIAKLCDHYKTR